MSSLHLASGRRSLLSAFTQASTSAGSRARSTLATPWVIRSTSKPATTVRSPLVNTILTWIYAYTFPSQTVAQTQTRQRSTLATPWVIRSTSKPSTTVCTSYCTPLSIYANVPIFRLSLRPRPVNVPPSLRPG
jgi:hypothetical protein